MTSEDPTPPPQKPSDEFNWQHLRERVLAREPEQVVDVFARLVEQSVASVRVSKILGDALIEMQFPGGKPPPPAETTFSTEGMTEAEKSLETLAFADREKARLSMNHVYQQLLTLLENVEDLEKTGATRDSLVEDALHALGELKRRVAAR